MKSQQCRDNEKTQRTKRGKKCLWIFLCVVFVMVLGILFWRIILYKSVDEQLAAILKKALETLSKDDEEMTPLSQAS